MQVKKNLVKFLNGERLARKVCFFGWFFGWFISVLSLPEKQCHVKIEVLTIVSLHGQNPVSHAAVSIKYLLPAKFSCKKGGVFAREISLSPLTKKKNVLTKMSYLKLPSKPWCIRIFYQNATPVYRVDNFERI